MTAQEEQEQQQQHPQQSSPFDAPDGVSTLLISYRGEKVEMPLVPETTVVHVKRAIPSALLLNTTSVGDGDNTILQPCDYKLMLKGRLLKNDDEDLYQTLVLSSNNNNNNNKTTRQKKVVHRIMASGVSRTESAQLQSDQAKAPRIRDDLSQAGKREIARRQRLGKQVLQQSATRNKRPSFSNKLYGFGKIQTLPNIDDEAQARQILTSLSNDPGILACMAKHQWHVGSLSELYPDGQVGQSAVCVMGLNRNAGQEILLRLRTDDLQGFRKMASIRQVLYHELAHNVHTEHDAKFFQLMRQVERECQELDWTHGAGLASTHDVEDDNEQRFQGGTFRLGGGGGGVQGLTGSSYQHHQHQQQQKRELAARAALSRMTAEEEKEIENGCASCGLRGDLFLPKQINDNSK